MADSNPNLASKKRIRQSSFTGIFTRHKSQIYLHRNRSGRTRSDSSRNLEMHINPPDSIAKRPRKIFENTDDDWSRVFIRDLRARRVFSPASSIQNDSEKDRFGGVVMSDVLCVKDDVNVRENGGIKESIKGDLNGNAENMTDDMVVVEGFQNVFDGIQNGFGGLKEEECLQSTPPNMEMFGCSIVENEREMAPNLNPNVNAGKNGVSSGNDDKKNGNALGNKFILSPCSRSRVRVFKAPGSFSYRRLLPILADMARESSHCPVAKKQSDISEHLSPKPTIEEETEKDDNLQNMSPGCLLQRENLMPDGADEPIPTYDKEAEKINVEPSCIVEFRSDTVQELSLNSEKDLQNGDEKPCKHELNINAGVNNSSNTITGNAIQSSSQLPQNPSETNVLSNNSGQHVKLAASNVKSKLGLSPCAKLKRFKTPRSFSYKRMLPFLMEITKDESGDSGNTHSPDRREDQSLPLSSDIAGIPYGKQNIKCLDDMQVSTDTSTNDASDSNCLSVISTEQVNKSSQEKELAEKNAGAEKDKNLSAVLWSGYTPSMEHPQCEKALAVRGISQNSSLVYGTDPVRIGDCSRKSILKRNPRGCRGLCSCLNCASFRLHAERAFEFSKNQVQDAEEIALNLVRELSQLRNILEKTATSDANSGVICSNQVKEACKKASEVEEVAKGRLREMMYDLNVHCRIPCSQPPRVTFAIDEGLISGALQSKSEEKQ